MYKSYSINCLNFGLDFIYGVLKINGAWDVCYLWIAYKIIVTGKLSHASGSAFHLVNLIKYSMQNKEQTRKLASGCSKHRFEVADKANVVWRVLD